MPELGLLKREIRTVVGQNIDRILLFKEETFCSKRKTFKKKINMCVDMSKLYIIAVLTKAENQSTSKMNIIM